MTKNSRRRGAKKTAAKKAAKTDQLKLQKRAQTENVTATLNKGLGLVYSVGVFLRSDKSMVRQILQRSNRHNRHNRYRTIPFKRMVMLKNC